MQAFLQDLRFAVRQLRKNIGFASTAVLMMALGICTSVAIFAFVDAALLKPLPYVHPHRLVGVTESAALIPRANLSYLDYLDWKKLNHVFASFDVYTGTGFMLSTHSGADLVRGARVSDGFFRTLGVVPMLGRDFYAGEDQPNAPNTVILSYTTWQKRFARRKDIIGQTVTLSGVVNTIVGVLPPDFQFAPRGTAEFWATIHTPNGCEVRRSCHNLDGVARLKDGVSVQAALADMTSIALQLEKQYPDSNRDQGASVLPLSEVIVGSVRPILLVLLAGAALLFLIACINVASLLLARSQSRKREMAVRNALGASAARLIRQFAAEGLVLVAASALLGLVFAEWAMHLLLRLVPADLLANMPYLQGIGLNPRVLAFAALISLFAAALFSLAPMLRIPLSGSGSALREGLAEGGRGSAGTMWRRFGSNLVILELAIAMVLLAGAGLLGKSFYRMLHVNLGFEPDHLATLTVALPELTYAKDPQLVDAARLIIARAASLPGVRSVATTSVLPVSCNCNTDWIRFAGHPYHGEHNEVNAREVSAAFFTTVQAKLLRGRYFTDAEDASKPGVVIINQKLAQQYFPGEDPIGKIIGDTTLSPKSLRQIIGVVEDIKDSALDGDLWAAVYYPFNQGPDSSFSLLVRTSQTPQTLLPALVAAVHQVDAGIGVSDEGTMEEQIHDAPSSYLHRSAACLVAGFAALALMLSIIGLYGVIAYSVSQRTREIGVRMALGAERASVVKLILREAGVLVAGGLLAGFVASVLAAMMMRKLLFGIRSWDVPTLAAVALLLAVAALAASYFPARSAASVNPVEALRAE